MSEKFGVVKVAGREFNVVDDVGRLDWNKAREEGENIGALQASWSLLAATARRDANNGKVDLEIAKAQISKEKRQRFESLGTKITERAIEEEALLDPRWREAHAHYHELVFNAEAAEGVKFSVVTKARSIEVLAPFVLGETRSIRSAHGDMGDVGGPTAVAIPPSLRGKKR